MNKLIMMMLLVVPSAVKSSPMEPPQAPPVMKVVKKTKDCNCAQCTCDPCQCRRYTVYDVSIKQCLPCLRFRPLFQAWATKYRKFADFKEVDAELDFDVPRRFGVRNYPTIIVTDGNKHTVFVGAPTQTQIENAIGLKTKVSYSQAIEMVKKGETVILAVGEPRRSLSDFGGIPVYECSDVPSKTEKGHYRCSMLNGQPSWEIVH